MMNDALDPIVRQLGRAAAAGRHEREALAGAVIPMVLDSAAHLAGSGRVRACLFRFAPGTPMMLVPAACSGRVDDPLEPVAGGTAEGELVFGMIRHNQHLFCPDLDASPPPGWRVMAPQTYKSFAAVPVAVPVAWPAIAIDLRWRGPRFRVNPDLSAFMLCHTFVTTMLDAGVDLRDVRIAARHADPRTTRAGSPEPGPPRELHPRRLYGLWYLTEPASPGA